MSEQKIYTEQELFEVARSLLANGFGHMYIFKLLKTKTADGEIISNVMDRLKADTTVEKERAETLEKYSGKENPYFSLVMGFVIFGLGLALYFGLDSRGFIAVLPFILMIGGIGYAISGKFR